MVYKQSMASRQRREAVDLVQWLADGASKPSTLYNTLPTAQAGNGPQTIPFRQGIQGIHPVDDRERNAFPIAHDLNPYDYP